MPKTCLDLFAGTGGFSSAFRDAENWSVIEVERDGKHDPDVQADVWDLQPSDLPNADVVLASPPCTYFSTAGNHDAWDGQEPTSEAAQDAIGLVHHTLGLIHGLDPQFWFLENPRGRLRWFLGNPTGTVTYCQYGRPYQKPTDLWGRHPPGMTYRSCSKGADCHESNTEDDGTPATASMPDDYPERAAVPIELSESILNAVEGFGEQQTLKGVV